MFCFIEKKVLVYTGLEYTFTDRAKSVMDVRLHETLTHLKEKLTMIPAVQGLSRKTAHTRKVQASTRLIDSRSQWRRPTYCSQKRKG